MARTKRVMFAVVCASIGALLSFQIAMATVQSVAGAVPNNGSEAYYTVVRCATYTGSPSLQVTSYPGSDLYVGYKLTSTGGESNDVHFSNGNSYWQQIGNLVSGTCFKLKAHKDWTWFNGTTNWTGNLNF